MGRTRTVCPADRRACLPRCPLRDRCDGDREERDRLLERLDREVLEQLSRIARGDRRPSLNRHPD